MGTQRLVEWKKIMTHQSLSQPRSRWEGENNLKKIQRSRHYSLLWKTIEKNLKKEWASIPNLDSGVVYV